MSPGTMRRPSELTLGIVGLGRIPGEQPVMRLQDTCRRTRVIVIPRQPIGALRSIEGIVGHVRILHGPERAVRTPDVIQHGLPVGPIRNGLPYIDVVKNAAGAVHVKVERFHVRHRVPEREVDPNPVGMNQAERDRSGSLPDRDMIPDLIAIPGVRAAGHADDYG